MRSLLTKVLLIGVIVLTLAVSVLGSYLTWGVLLPGLVEIPW